MITEHTIDAAGRPIGRIASEAASLLMGKNMAAFARNILTDVKVNIVNAAKTKISRKKMVEKEYFSFSGYPGGRTSQTLAELIKNSGYKEVYRNAVYGMLPKNKLRKEMMKNLEVTE